MIHLFSNVYLTYFETMQPENASGIVVGGIDRVSNFIQSTTTPRIGRHSSYNEVFGKPEDFTELMASTHNGEKKIIVYMDEINFKEFVIKWLKSGYVKASSDKLYQIYRFYGDCELTKVDRVKLFEDGNQKCNALEKIKQYWNLSKDEFLDLYKDIPKYEFPNEVYQTLGYELVITNALLGSEYYQNKLKDKAFVLYGKMYPDGTLSKEEVYEDVVTGKDELMLFSRMYDVQARFNTYLVALAIKTKDEALTFSRGMA